MKLGSAFYFMTAALTAMAGKETDVAWLAACDQNDYPATELGPELWVLGAKGVVNVWKITAPATGDELRHQLTVTANGSECHCHWQ